jgi:hypothetical protein
MKRVYFDNTATSWPKSPVLWRQCTTTLLKSAPIRGADWSSVSVLTVNARQGQNPGTRQSSLTPVWLPSMTTIMIFIRMLPAMMKNISSGMLTTPSIWEVYGTVDYKVQKSTFGDGTEVWVNYGLTTYRESGFIIPPKGFKITIPGKAAKIGTITSNITYIKE